MDLKKLTDRFLWVGKLEGYSYLALLGIAMPLKYFFHRPQFVRVVGMAHGLLFIAFVVLLALMFFKAKMPFKNAVISFLLSFVPFGTFYLKSQVTRPE
jgi:integral membrane protein